MNLIKLKEPYTEAEGNAWIERCRKWQGNGGEIRTDGIYACPPYSFSTRPHNYAIVPQEQGEPEYQPVNGDMVDGFKTGDCWHINIKFIGHDIGNSICKEQDGTLDRFKEVRPHVPKLTDAEKLEKIRSLSIYLQDEEYVESVKEIVGGDQ